MRYPTKQEYPPMDIPTLEHGAVGRPLNRLGFSR
jgi:hypothetical protein